MYLATRPQFHDLHMTSSWRVTPTTFTLAWLQLTKFEGEISDLALFSLAPNLAELICTFEDDGSFPTIVTHRCLRTLKIDQDSGDIIQYLSLPALQYLDAIYMASYDSLESFLRRSSPPLITLFVHGDAELENDEDESESFDLLLKCMPLVASTLENFGLAWVSDRNILSISDIFRPLSNIRTVSFVGVPLNLRFLVEFLYARSDKLRSFRAVWPLSVFPFLEGTTYAGPQAKKHYYDTIIGHLSHLAQSGVDIHPGTDDKNYLSIAYVCRIFVPRLVLIFPGDFAIGRNPT
jgi:hypothetical protein